LLQGQVLWDKCGIFRWMAVDMDDRISRTSIVGDTRMQIIAKCPRCGSVWLLDSIAADRRITCGKCARLFKVPKAEEVPKAAQTIEQAKGTIYVDEAGRTYG